MKNILKMSKGTLMTIGIFSVLFFTLMLNVSGNITTSFLSTGMNFLWYGSNGDYSNPQNTFTWNVVIGTWQTLTGATEIKFTNPIQVSSGAIQIIIPKDTIITTASGSSFDSTQITTYVLPTPSLSLPTNQKSVGHIKFWIENIKLNFTKPVRLQIPVNTPDGTIEIMVKHFWNTQYTTDALTNTLSANCFNGRANPSNNNAPVTNGIATIYTCSASEFVAVKTLSSPAQNPIVSSGWWGGWVRLYIDNCPDGDYSPSYYDRTCGTKPALYQQTEKEMKENSQNSKQEQVEKPKITLWDQLRYKFVSELKAKTVTYKGYSILTYPWYKHSLTAEKINKRIIDHKTLPSNDKQRYVTIVNNYLQSRYTYDLSIRAQQISKNKFNKNTILMKAVLRNLNK